MAEKTLTVAFYRRSFKHDEWRKAWDEQQLAAFFAHCTQELASLGFALRQVEDGSVTMDIKGYGDLLNSVRIRCPQQGIGNMCLGHIIGRSANLNLVEDIERGINRVAFAPETIEPEGSDKVVCHNCGCGC
ncbi:hypothetical protein SAMN05660860_00808 [Geoalkalibacter ferrihydriticus]|uniref:Uncharacterized protein n=2 Tax=Geoalkalibacter ferrihydriticus TaxID=392333 RepID=A0A0C2HVM6_9BACT|nr:hypothetical protein [Geoalkalibacter ferrihydriticus]KIH76792.1 hypothetical protein GFER_06640 [Geoalkalibacter ferrihydriticus DSM 17813]SDL50813.1 hypothetical protein SAMN05660860_00808 [Geoalkalibacter ferrihydriticus]